MTSSSNAAPVSTLAPSSRPQAHKFAPGPELLRSDPSEACDKLRTVLKVLGGFKSCCFSYRAASSAECPAHPWRFQNAAAFARLDRHMARCAEMLSLAGAALQFNRLERVEVGGTKGKTITAAIKAVHSDFAGAYERFQQVGGRAAARGCDRLRVGLVLRSAVRSTPASYRRRHQQERAPASDPRHPALPPPSHPRPRMT